MEGVGQERPSLIHTASLISMPGLCFLAACLYVG